LYILSACNAIQHLEMEGASSDWSMWVCQSGKYRLILGSGWCPLHLINWLAVFLGSGWVCGTVFERAGLCRWWVM
jgi:hypothetical protein